jgi:hypothetical protein
MNTLQQIIIRMAAQHDAKRRHTLKGIADRMSVIPDAHFTVTQLIDPPYMIQLNRRATTMQRAAIVTATTAQDVASAIRGIAVHDAVQTAIRQAQQSHNPIPGVEPGVRIAYMVEPGWVISTEPDFIETDPDTSKRTVVDIKTVRASVTSARKEWVQQLRFEAILLAMHFSRVQQAAIECWHMDYTPGGVTGSSGAFLRIPIPLDNLSKDELMERFSLHKLAVHQHQDEISPCTPEECWAKPDQFVVQYIDTNKTLKGGIHATPEAAAQFIVSGNYKRAVRVAHRRGVCVRCLNYCNVRAICPFGIQRAGEAACATSEPDSVGTEVSG